MLRRILIGTLLALHRSCSRVAGGAYLYFHQSVASVRAHTPDVVRAARSLDIPVAHHAAIALVIGYDHRAGVESNRPSLSDTIMLIRADPQTKTISLLSFPRDLDVPIYCGSSPSDSVGHVVTTDRINSAYSRCGAKGTLLTIKHLTSLPINYLITVNFHGFKEVVDKLGGVWMDVDRRYYNKNTGSAYDNYANIDLQPGYQRLDGQQALDFVRFRHTDSDLYRLARQQEFVRAFKDQVANNFSFTALPSLVNAITHNIEVGEGGRALQGDQVISYALFAQSLPPGHLFQQKIENVQCSLGCTASENDIQSAVDQFANPDVTVAEGGECSRTRSEAQAEVPAAVVGVDHRAERQRRPRRRSERVVRARAAGLRHPDAAERCLGERPGEVPLGDLLRPGSEGVEAGGDCAAEPDAARRCRQAAATSRTARARPRLDAARRARERLPRLDRPGSACEHPGSSACVRALRLGARDRLAQAAGRQVQVPAHGADGARAQLVSGHASRRRARPAVLAGPSRRASSRAARLPRRQQYWGIEETDWNGAPALSDKSFRHDLGGREFDLYYSGSHLHMVVLHAHGATYWVVNTLLDDLSNETMLAIAKGLKPLTPGK